MGGGNDMRELTRRRRPPLSGLPFAKRGCFVLRVVTLKSGMSASPYEILSSGLCVFAALGLGWPGLAAAAALRACMHAGLAGWMAADDVQDGGEAV